LLLLLIQLNDGSRHGDHVDGRHSRQLSKRSQRCPRQVRPTLCFRREKRATAYGERQLQPQEAGPVKALSAS
jgi:hypothetical protein